MKKLIHLPAFLQLTNQTIYQKIKKQYTLTMKNKKNKDILIIIELEFFDDFDSDFEIKEHNYDIIQVLENDTGKDYNLSDDEKNQLDDFITYNLQF